MCEMQETLEDDGSVTESIKRASGDWSSGQPSQATMRPPPC